ncbi:MAG: hypothetical protein AAF715_14045 [Myxococcota bacterium]
MPLSTPLFVLALMFGGCGSPDGALPREEMRPPTRTAVAPPAAPAAPRTPDTVSTVSSPEVETVDDTVPPAVDDDDEGCAPKGADVRPMQLLAMTFTSGIDARNPRDELKVARPGQRVYAHLKVRNRSGRRRCLDLTFRVGGKKRSEVRLKVGPSWSWRTWAYNTLRRDDRRPMELDIVDDQGETLFEGTLPVVPAPP